MTSIKSLTYPQFADGDLVTFSFDGAELMFPALAIENDRYSIDRVFPMKDLRHISTADWESDEGNNPYQLLLMQQWKLEDKSTLDDIATCRLYVAVMEVEEPHRKANTLLSYPAFEKYIPEFHAKTFPESELNPDGTKSPCLANRFLNRIIENQPINWLVCQLPLGSCDSPTEIVTLPLNNRFVLMIYISIESLHYPGRTNPYSEETLKQFERDLFNEFLNNIRVDYSPELIAKINSLKTKTPA